MSILILQIIIVYCCCIIQHAFCQQQKVCPWPTRSVEGEFALRRYVKSPGEYVPATKLEFKCANGWKLVGENKEPLVCQRNGQWSAEWLGCRSANMLPSKPVKNNMKTSGGSSRPCKKACFWPGRPDKGYVMRPSFFKKKFSHGERIEFGCNGNLYMLGASRTICRDGVWSDRVPTCQTRDNSSSSAMSFCPLLSSGVDHLPNATSLQPAVFVSASSPNFLVGTAISFTCLFGRRLRGVAQITCTKSGRWSALVPSCIEDDHAITCPADRIPDAPPSAFFVGVGRAKRVFLPGSSVAYRCLAGKVPTGYNRAHCKRDGTWSQPKLSCAPMTTTSTTTAMPLCQKLDSKKSVPGSSQAFKPLKVDFISANGKRVPSRPDEAPGSDLVVPEEGSQYEFECDSRYRLVGDRRMVCLKGQWKGEVPMCELIPTTTVAPACSPLNELVSRAGARSLLLETKLLVATKNTMSELISSGTVYTFSCPSTHEVVGDRRMVCVDGKWVGEVPSCVAKPTTPDPCSMMPQPGPKMIVSRLHIGNNHTVIYSCENGYTLSPSHGTATCKGGKWKFTGGSEIFPKCVMRPRVCSQQYSSMQQQQQQFVGYQQQPQMMGMMQPAPQPQPQPSYGLQPQQQPAFYNNRMPPPVNNNLNFAAGADIQFNAQMGAQFQQQQQQQQMMMPGGGGGEQQQQQFEQQGDGAGYSLQKRQSLETWDCLGQVMQINLSFQTKFRVSSKAFVSAFNQVNKRNDPNNGANGDTANM